MACFFFGSAWGPVILPVFKTGGRRVCPVAGAFDSHTLPPFVFKIHEACEINRSPRGALWLPAPTGNRRWPDLALDLNGLIFRLCTPDIFSEPVVVAHENAQPETQRLLRVAGYKLFLVMVEIEVKGIAGIHINEHQIRITHGQLAESKLIAPIRHVVREGYMHQRGRGCVPKDLYDVFFLQAHPRYLPVYVRRRKQRRRAALARDGKGA